MPEVPRRRRVPIATSKGSRGGYPRQRLAPDHSHEVNVVFEVEVEWKGTGSRDMLARGGLTSSPAWLS